MTREEEIQKAAETYTQEIIHGTTFDVNFEEDNYDAGSLHATSEVCPMAFIAGAKYADEHHAKKQTVTIDAWVARDKNAFLSIHNKKPTLINEAEWVSVGFLYIDPTNFPFVTFENSPKKVKITIELEDEK